MSGTQWVRLDVQYLRNPKVRRVSEAGVLLHLAAILYLGGHRIDTGLLPPEALPLVAVDARVPARRVEVVVGELVKAGLWHPETLGGGYLVHDYDETNGAASEAAAARDRKRRWRERVTDT